MKLKKKKGIQGKGKGFTYSKAPGELGNERPDKTLVGREFRCGQEVGDELDGVREDLVVPLWIQKWEEASQDVFRAHGRPEFWK